MRRMVAFLMMTMVVAASLPRSGAIDCYTCEGFNPVDAENNAYNNKFCPQESFDSTQIGVSRGGFCFAEVRVQHGHRITKRGTDLGTRKMTRDATTDYNNHMVTYSGYYCNRSLCNGMDPASPTIAAAPSSHPAAQLLIVPLIISLSRYLL